MKIEFLFLSSYWLKSWYCSKRIKVTGDPLNTLDEIHENNYFDGCSPFDYVNISRQ